MDFQMPRMNGLETTRVLNQMLPTVPIILFTLHKDLLHASDIAGSGIKAVMSKTDSLDLLHSHGRRLRS